MTRAIESDKAVFWRNNSLSIVLASLFALSMVGQTWTGWFDYNADAVVHGSEPVTLPSYLASGHFWEATGENWESEFLQMAMFVVLTCFLRQKGSAESKRIDVVEDVDLDPRRFSDHPESPWPVKRGGWILRVYENSLGLVFAILFLISITLHATGGLAEFNEEQQAHHRPPVVLSQYVFSSRFWFESFQNWQSEFLSLLAMVMGTVYLRQKGSAESKPLHVANSETGR
ncbi:MAG: DUF6766 family protein [Vicinamibacterales bacterium]